MASVKSKTEKHYFCPMKKLFPLLILALVIIAYFLYSKNLVTKIGTPSIIEEFSIESKNLNRNVKIWVYLPQDYLQAEKKLPILYMHDGQNLFDDKLAFAGEWHVDESLDSIYQKTGKQLVVVGIENGGEKRLDELTPYPNEKYGGGKADTYLKFITDELMPQIQQKYNVSDEAKNTGMTGSSLGGLITFYAAYKHADKFSKFGVYSPSLWFSEDIFALAKSQNLPNATRMLMMIGEKEQDEHLNVQKMEKVLEKQNIQLKTEIHPDGEHNEGFWSSEFKDDVEWLFFAN